LTIVGFIAEVERKCTSGTLNMNVQMYGTGTEIEGRTDDKGNRDREKGKRVSKRETRKPLFLPWACRNP
jgi:hypothetical protein